MSSSAWLKLIRNIVNCNFSLVKFKVSIAPLPTPPWQSTLFLASELFRFHFISRYSTLVAFPNTKLTVQHQVFDTRKQTCVKTISILNFNILANCIPLIYLLTLVDHHRFINYLRKISCLSI